MSHGRGTLPELQDHVHPSTCDICGKSFSRKDNLNRHQLIHSGLKLHKCSDCGYKTTSADQLKQHVIAKHTKEYRHICSRCGKGFLTPKQLRAHDSNDRCHEIEVSTDASDHGDSRSLEGKDGMHKCSLCNYSASLETELKVHIQTHSGERPYHCADCPRRFARASHLRSHLRIHTDGKPFRCKQCGQEFREQFHLRQHERVHIVRPWT